jgi:addiction module RelE/StbE family toxin
MKKKYPVFYLPPAEQDLGELFEYIMQDSPSEASILLDKVDRSIMRLSQFPLSGATPRDKYLKKKGYRILIIGDYLVFYRFENRKIFIYRVLHGKRQYKFLF